MDCIFCDIVSGKIEANLLYEDEYIAAFDDIAPQAPVHKLIIPKKHIATINDLKPEDATIVGNMFLVAAKLAKQLNIDESGYRTVMNCNQEGGQAVYHIHLHLLGGRTMTWPPG